MIIYSGKSPHLSSESVHEKKAGKGECSESTGLRERVKHSPHHLPPGPKTQAAKGLAGRRCKPENTNAQRVLRTRCLQFTQ